MKWSNGIYSSFLSSCSIAYQSTRVCVNNHHLRVHVLQGNHSSLLFKMFVLLSDTSHLTCTSCGQGVYYQIGDVIKVIDEDDGKPYYAQIRGFVQDQYCEKSAALTWLIPTQASPRDRFDPGTYIVGKFLQK